MILLALAEGGIQLVPDGTLVIHVIAIVVMVFILNATLFKPINKVLAAREKQGKGKSGEAGEILRRVESKLGAYEERLRAARTEAYQLLETEHAAAREAREATLAGIRRELLESTTQEKRELARQAEEARGTLEGNARQLAGEVSRRILGRAI